MKKIIIISLLLHSTFSLSQNIKVIDKESKLAIQFATIKLLKDNKPVNGYYTDEKGNFNFNFNFASFDNQIIVSCIGYKTQRALIKSSANIIELEQEIFNLNEVVICNKKYIQIGYVDKPKTKSVVGVSTGLEVAVFIENKFDYESKINSILFKIKKTKEKIAFRVHLYKISENELKPEEDLLHNNSIYYIEPKTTGLVEINLSEYNIILPKKGVFVCIEGIGGTNTNTTRSKENVLKFESHKSSLPIYQERNQLNNVGWVNINEWLPNNYLHTFNKLYDMDELYVPSFGLKVSKIITE